ncbi:hypothetical protein F9C07_2894 [Aspergillus flavus]|uniref:Uncharacterized protein n=2 Tax=Aspergillus flavus TaxID=5059 RepID=A0A7U2MED3_ASPFN|nr:hypothetical protein AFLA_001390 [Aspergillus flavus NRRL3357]KAJ1717412.1 hypothetical protein NYO67_575 [Aspergillus flavus]QRD82186.1 hypothetical protein F9C07_2894 [Aspergillus flavus]RMZ46089.1 hypothetical protein CA14_011777 [Aspergillus flavus]UDD55693.1 hypothetical protein AFCA_003290 [Aspergillus flavus]
MDVPQETVDKIQRFAVKREKAEESYDQQISPATLQAYNKKLDETLKNLQEQVKRQEDDLRKLRSVNAVDLSKIGADPSSRVSQVRRAKKAYDSLLGSETKLPSSGSPLPSLLAVEEISRLVKESKLSVTMTADKLSTNRQRLKVEEANLRDAQAINDGLQKRIARIREQQAKKEQKSPSQLAHDLVDQQQEKKEELDKATEELQTSLHNFIDETLAPMLAAEDLGGPTAGDAMSVSDETLERGYTSHGKPKKPKASAANHDSGQRRIDELVRGQTSQGENQERNPSNRREAAAAEMHELLTSLLDAGTSYIDLPRESAAARFLVRAKVAQFHPRDARRLRLIDFGRSLND